ncbi:hypothetical protein M885DRAFT_538708 [Pelagophyceae sp. CCMP2097]|nr:hypothetical protein M885DRAFT_538708 [Pelagophyceae sp. CCMP2097]
MAAVGASPARPSTAVAGARGAARCGAAAACDDETSQQCASRLACDEGCTALRYLRMLEPLAPDTAPEPAPDAAAWSLTPAQIAHFQQNGFVVVEGVLDAEGAENARRDFQAALLEYGVDLSKLADESSTHALKLLSSTHGAGGVLDLFYDRWKLELSLENERYVTAMKQLLTATYGTNAAPWEHPYGKISGDVWAHVDRVGCRVADVEGGGKSVQRSLTPHLDCCPDALHSGGNKQFPRWRPIQCLLSLTATLEAGQGGFECAPGFHLDFEEYYARRQQTMHDDANDNALNKSASAKPGATTKPGASAKPGAPAAKRLPCVKLPCVGDYIAVSARDDPYILRRFQHIPIPTGAAIFWDQRLPHANALRNTAGPRLVLYGGFLPRGVPCNDAYAKEQLRRLLKAEAQPDFWMGKKSTLQTPPLEEISETLRRLSPSAKEMLGLVNL